MGEEVRGGFVHRSQIVEPSNFVLSEKGQEIQEKLWKETLDILSKVDPRVSKVAKNILP
ncbi:hypothetical protein AX15_005700 [Amanita polypyramis BW_CC]|nr:hypothetical protein AX15_005700 [Amanita polypyramis BW_CC]